MKDRLEDFVNQNREKFDLREPDPSLWLKINPANEGVRRNKRLVWLRYAAAIALIFASISAGIYYMTGANQKEQDLYGDLYEKMIETEAYYTRMVTVRYNELQPYMNQSPEIKEELDFDLEELDNIYLELKEDLKDNVGNPEVVEAMINQYRMKVQILEELLNQIKEKEHKYEDENEISL